MTRCIRRARNSAIANWQTCSKQNRNSCASTRMWNNAPMSALPEHAPRPAFEAPADIAATAEISDWRTRTWWPIGIVEANEIAAAQAHRALGFVAALDPEKARDAA